MLPQLPLFRPLLPSACYAGYDRIYSLDLLPVITKATRITNHTATLIDHIYTNNISRLTSGIVTVDISDHLPVFRMVDTSLKKQIDKIRILETTVNLTQNHTSMIFTQLTGMRLLNNAMICMK